MRTLFAQSQVAGVSLEISRTPILGEAGQFQTGTVDLSVVLKAQCKHMATNRRLSRGDNPATQETGTDLRGCACGYAKLEPRITGTAMATATESGGVSPLALPQARISSLLRMAPADFPVHDTGTGPQSLHNTSITEQ